MNKNEARRQAVEESMMYRFGDGWVISTQGKPLVCKCPTWYVSPPGGYHLIQSQLTAWRKARVEELLSREEK